METRWSCLAPVALPRCAIHFDLELSLLLYPPLFVLVSPGYACIRFISFLVHASVDGVTDLPRFENRLSSYRLHPFQGALCSSNATQCNAIPRGLSKTCAVVAVVVVITYLLIGPFLLTPRSPDSNYLTIRRRSPEQRRSRSFATYDYQTLLSD
ncbi:hypothetical protein BDN70DRAFT_44765 [Pholiota conissans]|uniref:Uncharacterized protein n=1 Tax=Pholiota conissans TaxID=109636 RepID=A0A9P5Z2V0_9AGAR|nr:hypothetical protein BDN70DRAFT_44765 [Pholiota conissans]